MNDLLKQKRLLQLLKDDNQLFDELLTNSKESIVLIDKNYQICEWNAGTETITDIPKKDVIGKNFLEIIEFILPKVSKNIKLKNFIRNALQNAFYKQNLRLLDKSLYLGISNTKNEKKY